MSLISHKLQLKDSVVSCITGMFPEDQEGISATFEALSQQSAKSLESTVSRYLETRLSSQSMRNRKRFTGVAMSAGDAALVVALCSLFLQVWEVVLASQAGQRSPIPTNDLTAQEEALRGLLDQVLQAGTRQQHAEEFRQLLHQIMSKDEDEDEDQLA